MTQGYMVEALAGREKGELFCVLGQEEGYLLLANGKGRGVQNPKRKKVKHAQWVQPFSHPTLDKLARGEEVTNKEVRKVLASYQVASKEDISLWQRTI